MDLHYGGIDIDLCLDAPQLSHANLLRLMAAVDDLLFPWSVDLLFRHEIPEDLGAHIHRVGRCLWCRQVNQTTQYPQNLPLWPTLPHFCHLSLPARLQ